MSRAAVIVQIRDINTKGVVASQQISADSGKLQRQQLAERLADKHSDRRDVYAVEIEKTHQGKSGGVIDKYGLDS